MKKFDFCSDAGHAWLKVPVKLLIDLDIADQISAYSYYRAGFAYLEEDCDFSRFFNAYRARFGTDPAYRERNARERRSRIRGYDTYNKAHHVLKKALLSIPAAAALHNAGKLEIISI